MADEIQAQFEDAAARAQKLSKRPDNETMLKLYSLYKQATTGDVSDKRPGFADFVGRAKYDAWSKLKGQSSSEAMRAYITLVDELEAG
jgi:diazepam-binding inhibitor (GABA receptor modulating acyl-CoA-binding protein)